MRKHLLATTTLLLVAIICLLSCQKEVIQTLENDFAINSANKAKENPCRLKSTNWPNYSTWQLRYNDKGLADQWIIDYGPDYPLHINEMIYDHNNMLIQSNEELFDLHYVYNFYYSSARLTRLLRTCVEFPNRVQDIRFSYNNRGENIKQDDIINDEHVLMTYDAMGNCTQLNIVLGTKLWYSDNYTFRLPARNPKSIIPGVKHGFPFYGGVDMSDKRMFASNRTEVYDNGDLFLLNDFDQGQTTMITDNQNFPTSAIYYDRVSESTINITFGYEHCHGSNAYTKVASPTNSFKSGVNDPSVYKKPLLILGTAKLMKEQAKISKQHFLKQRNQ